MGPQGDISLQEDTLKTDEMEDRAMKFERPTDAGPEGERSSELLPQAKPRSRYEWFFAQRKPKSNCRLERTTAEMTAGSGSPIVRPCFYNVPKIHDEYDVSICFHFESNNI